MHDTTIKNLIGNDSVSVGYDRNEIGAGMTVTGTLILSGERNPYKTGRMYAVVEVVNGQPQLYHFSSHRCEVDGSSIKLT